MPGVESNWNFQIEHVHHDFGQEVGNGTSRRMVREDSDQVWRLRISRVDAGTGGVKAAFDADHPFAVTALPGSAGEERGRLPGLGARLQRCG